jgi:hypothetical protein
MNWMASNTDEIIENKALTKSLIRISDPDQPIYRIFPLWFLEDAIHWNRLTLVRPSVWEGPFEIKESYIKAFKGRGADFKQWYIGKVLRPVFAQCWSATGDSDTLQRAYSRVEKDPHFQRNIYPRLEGVRVKSTPRKLMNAVVAGAPRMPTGQCYIGSVRYLSVNDIGRNIANTLGEHGIDAYHDSKRRAELLLLKRKAFMHEDEIRIIFVCDEPTVPQGFFNAKIDPSEAFESITFDPRLSGSEINEREAIVRQLGYKGTIDHIDLYTTAMLWNIRLD